VRKASICVRPRPDRPLRGVSRTHRTHLARRLLSNCCHRRHLNRVRQPGRGISIEADQAERAGGRRLLLVGRAQARRLACAAPRARAALRCAQRDGGPDLPRRGVRSSSSAGRRDRRGPAERSAESAGPTFEQLACFDREFRRLSREQQRAFLAMLPLFIAALRASPPVFPSALRVYRVKGATGVWEITFAPDGRATFEYGSEVSAHEPHVVWPDAMYRRPPPCTVTWCCPRDTTTHPSHSVHARYAHAKPNAACLCPVRLTPVGTAVGSRAPASSAPWPGRFGCRPRRSRGTGCRCRGRARGRRGRRRSARRP
jgi:hypothetical protein